MLQELNTLTPETLETPLTEDQIKSIEAEKDSLKWTADQVVPVEEEIKKVEKVEDVVEQEEEEEVKEDEPSEEEKARLEKLAKDSGKTVEEIVEAEKAKTPEQKDQERLEAVAKEEGLTIEEVKAQEEKDKAVVANYGNDPVKIAKALRNQNSAYGKLKAEHESLAEYKRTAEINKAKMSEAQIDAGIEKQRDVLIAKYLEVYPDAQELSEDVVFERARFEVKQKIKEEQARKAADLKTKADLSREELIKKLPDEYKEFTSDIKAILKEEEDTMVTNPQFDIMNIAYWARGKKYTPEYVKSLEDAAYKRGVEQPKIKQSKANVISSGAGTQGGVKQKVTASQDDIRRANEMFASRDDWSQEKKVEEYITNHKQFDKW